MLFIQKFLHGEEFDDSTGAIDFDELNRVVKCCAFGVGICSVPKTEEKPELDFGELSPAATGLLYAFLRRYWLAGKFVRCREWGVGLQRGGLNTSDD